MARLFGFYEFDNPEKIRWRTVAFPEGDINQIPTVSGVYRFIIRYDNDNQTLFADIAPSSYGDSLRACYITHSSKCGDNLAELYPLYATENVEFEHHECTEIEATQHIRFIVSNFKPHYNIIIELRISGDSDKNPFTQ